MGVNVLQEQRPDLQTSLAYRMAVGDLVVTALNDSYIPFPAEAMTRISSDDIRALNYSRRIARPHVFVNAFLVNDGVRTLLIDTGCGFDTAPTPGRLIEAMTSVGVSPTDISAVLMTHLHSDHIGGITKPSGEPAFPNAEIVVPHEELKFWLNDPPAGAGGPVLDHFNAVARVQPLMNRLRGATAGEVIPNIYLNPEPGHTPGHCGYLIDSRNEQLLIWGDIVHQPQVQCPRPEAGVIWDIDYEAAVATRRRVLDQVASDELCVGGMHTDFHPFGYVTKEHGRYEFVHRLWSPIL
jgi:glyoxylase-like metal-dependent hydrolase (beta-lactamase superfamily II)